MTDLSTELALASSDVSLTPVSMDIQGDLSFEQWEDLTTKVMVTEAAAPWWLGDLLNYGEKKFGEKYAQVVEMTGRSVATLANWSWVANEYPHHERRTELSWSIHRELAPLEPNERAKWLDAAESEQWSKTELRQQLRITPDGDSPDISKPTVLKPDIPAIAPIEPDPDRKVSWITRVSVAETADLALVDERVKRSATALETVLKSLHQDPEVSTYNDPAPE